LSKIGTVTTQPSSCTSWGEGLTKTFGCSSCPAGFNTIYAPRFEKKIWSSTGNGSILQLRGSYQECKSKKCGLNPFALAATKGQRTEYFFVDPATGRSTSAGCPFNGEYELEDQAFVTSNTPGFTPFILQKDSLTCTDLTNGLCHKYSLYDFNARRTIEIARLLNEDGRSCTANDDGQCYFLRVVPSPRGSLLAVLLYDDIYRKSEKFKRPLSDFYHNAKVYFIESQALLKFGKVVKRGTQTLRIPKGQTSEVANLKWAPDEKTFGMVTSGEDSTGREVLRAANFFCGRDVAC